ncbi:hypothetical protein PanWU01x14_279560, partial [Parasponia andersonii]
FCIFFSLSLSLITNYTLSSPSSFSSLTTSSPTSKRLSSSSLYTRWRKPSPISSFTVPDLKPKRIKTPLGLHALTGTCLRPQAKRHASTIQKLLHLPVLTRE